MEKQKQLDIYTLIAGVDHPGYLGTVNPDESHFYPLTDILGLTGCDAEDLHLMLLDVTMGTVMRCPPAIAEFFLEKKVVAAYCCEHEPKRCFLICEGHEIE